MVHFPNEIWLGVANYLRLPTDVCTRRNETPSEDEKINQQAIISLCLVSKQLRAIFQPQLYCNFVKHEESIAQHQLLNSDSERQHKHHQQDERNSRAACEQSRLENFLFTIIHRPDLAAMVEQLRIGLFAPGDTHKKVSLDKSTSRAFVAALRSFEGFDSLRKHFRRSWKKSLKNGDEGAEVALLPTLLPNLCSLRFDSETGGLDYFVKMLLKTTLGSSLKSSTLKSAKRLSHERSVGLQSRLDQSPRILRSLKSLDVWSFDGYIKSLASCVGLLSQPTITSFHGRGLCVYGSLLSIQPEINFTSLLHLQLIRCKLDGEGLESVLKRCTKLQSLEINTKFAYNPDTMSRIPITNKHLSPLQNITNTLERLKIMLHDDYTGVSLDLRSFNKLHYLHVDMALLETTGHGPAFMHELLPESIEKVTIRRAHLWTQDLDELLDAMISNRRFPTLSSLKIYTLGWSHEHVQEELDFIQERARALQLHFQVEEDPSRRYSFTWGHDNPDSDSDLD
ncbi:hypothetical protein KCU95_g18855, partial [Aureobasidium melanogenum]